MKKITNYLKAIAALLLFTGANTLHAQCTASFNYTVSSGGLVTFSCTSVVPAGTTYYWGFGAGSSPTYTSGTYMSTAYTTYTANGTYVVTMSIINTAPTCSAGISQTITITGLGSPCAINANFTTSQGSSGLVNFNNTTTGTVTGATYSWAFGDGSTSTSASPAHTYGANGAYTATLIANNNVTPACVSTKTVMVNVNTYCNLNASFNYVPGSGGNVSFGNTSTGTTGLTTYSWMFGDGGTSTSISPSHIYLNGTYTVNMIATTPSMSPACADTVSHVITVTSNSCVAVSGFSMIPSGTPHDWFAVPSSSAGVGATWSWGDGSTSSGLFSSHTYSTAGNYSVCLTVTASCGAISTTCYTFYLSRSTQETGVIHIDVKDASEIATGIKTAVAKDVAYTVSPNPGNGVFNVNVSGLTANKAKINVYNLVGKLVYASESETANGTLVKEIDLDSASNGIYFIKVSADNNTYTQKIIINK